MPLDVMLATLNNETAVLLIPNVEVLLAKTQTKKAFVTAVGEIFGKACCARPNLVPAFVKLFVTIMNTSFVKEGMTMSFQQIISQVVTTLPFFKNKEIDKLLNSVLPLLNALCTMNLLRVGVFASMARRLVSNLDSVGATTFLLEIMINLDQLIDVKAVKLSHASEVLWDKCTLLLADVSNRRTTVDADKVLPRLFHFLDSLVKKGGWHRHKSAGGKSVTTTISETGLPISSILPITSSSPKVVASRSPAGQNSPDVPTLKNLLQLIISHPEQLTIVAPQMQSILAKQKSVEFFLDIVAELLSDAASAPYSIFEITVRLFCLIKEAKIEVNGSDFTLKDGISACAKQFQYLENSDQLLAFLNTFRLTNELYRLGLIDANIFRYYVEELTKEDRVLSIVFLFHVMRNVDMLMDNNVFKPTAKEAIFWEDCSIRLSTGCRKKLVDSMFLPHVVQFLQSVREKGGWQRTLCLDKANLPFAVSKIVCPPPPLPPPEANASASSENISANLEFISLTSIILLRGKVENAVKLLQQKLVSVSPEVFSLAIASLLEISIFQNIHDDDTLNCATNLIIELSKAKFGASKDLLLEFQKACFMRFNLSHRGDREKVKTLLQSRLQGYDTLQKAADIMPQMCQFEHFTSQRHVGCARLVVKLFQSGFLHFRFLVSFVDTLLLFKGPEALECLLELLSLMGREFYAQVQKNSKTEWFVKCFEELASLEKLPTTPKMSQALISEILRLKTDGWPTFNNKIHLRRRFRSILAELSPERLHTQSDLQMVVSRILYFLTYDCPKDCASRLHEIFVNNFQAYLSNESAHHLPLSNTVSEHLAAPPVFDQTPPVIAQSLPSTGVLPFQLPALDSSSMGFDWSYRHVVPNTQQPMLPLLPPPSGLWSPFCCFLPPSTSAQTPPPTTQLDTGNQPPTPKRGRKRNTPNAADAGGIGKVSSTSRKRNSRHTKKSNAGETSDNPVVIDDGRATSPPSKSCRKRETKTKRSLAVAVNKSSPK